MDLNSLCKRIKRGRTYNFKINKDRERKGLKDQESARTAVLGIWMGLSFRYSGYIGIQYRK
jgi:endonuclease YncB( thermonuclease family)